MLGWYQLSLLVQTILGDSLVSGGIYAGPGVTCPLCDAGFKTGSKIPLPVLWLSGQK